MLCHRNSQETQRNITCPNLQCFGCKWRLHLSLVSVQGETSGGDITGRFAGKGKLTFWKVLEDLTQTMTKYRHFYSFKWHNDHLKQPLVPLKHFLSVIFASHRSEECRRCKVVAFQEEAQYEDLLPPQKKLHFLPAIMRAHYQAMIQYNTISKLIKRLFLRMHAKRKIQYKKLKTKKNKNEYQKMQTEQYKIGKDIITWI